MSEPQTVNTQNESLERDYSLLRTTNLSLTLNSSTRRELEHLCFVYDISFEEIMEIAIEFGIYLEDSNDTFIDKDLATSLFNKMTNFFRATESLKKVYPAVEDNIVSLRVLQMELENLLPRREWINPKSKYGIYETSKDDHNAYQHETVTVWDYYLLMFEKYSSFLKDMDHSKWPKNYILNRTKCTFKINNFVYKNLNRISDFYNISPSSASCLMVNNMLLLLKMEVKHRTGDLKEDLIFLVNRAKSLSNWIIRLSETIEINYYKTQTSMELVQRYGIILQSKVKAGRDLYSSAEDGSIKITPRESSELPSTISKNPILPL